MQSVDHNACVALYTRLLEAWNRRSADDFAALFDIEGSAVGFDGSQMNGREAIAGALREVFESHETAAYVARIREVRALGPVRDAASFGDVHEQSQVGQIEPYGHGEGRDYGCA